MCKYFEKMYFVNFTKVCLCVKVNINIDFLFVNSVNKGYYGKSYKQK